MRPLLFILSFFVFVDASHSQVIDGVEIVKPRIITGEWDSVTKKFPVAVEFTIAKGWHMYWLNPGDAGSPPEVKWALPRYWSVDKLQFPVPQHLVEDGFESYVYFDTLTLYTEITSPSAPKPSDVIEAGIKWMVCKDICVAGKLVRTGSIEMTQQDHVWSKLPLIPTLEDAGLVLGYEIGGKQGDTNWVMGGIKGNEIHCCRTLQDFYPLFPGDAPIRLNFKPGLGLFTLHSKAKREVLESVNGLVFIDDKVYWLKQP